MKTTQDLKKHITALNWKGYGCYEATLTKRGKSIKVTFHDGDVWDRIKREEAYMADTKKGSGGLTLRQAYMYIWRKGEDRW